jgi:hypothetical protein
MLICYTQEFGFELGSGFDIGGGGGGDRHVFITSNRCIPVKSTVRRSTVVSCECMFIT